MNGGGRSRYASRRRSMRLAASAACKFPAHVQELDGALYLVGGDNGISWARLRKRVGRARVALLIEMDQLARSLDGEFTGFNPDDEWMGVWRQAAYGDACVG